MNRVVTTILIVLGILVGIVIVAIVAEAISMATGSRSVPVAVPGIVGGIGVFVAVYLMGRRARRQQAEVAAQHPDAVVIGWIFPFQPVRDAIAAIVGVGKKPSYGSQRVLVAIEHGLLSLRLPKGDTLLLEIPAAQVHELTTGELKIGMNRFPSLDLAVDTPSGRVTLPLPFTKPGAPTAKPDPNEFGAQATALHAALWPAPQA